MLQSVRDYLPRQLPLNDVKKTEEFTFEEIKLPDNESTYEDSYTLSKAPIDEVKSVQAVVNGESKKLEQGTHFILEQKSEIVFNDKSNIPDLGTDFSVTYVAESILSRYIDTVEEETEKISNEIGINPETGEINGVTASKYISTADEEELKRVGELFGDLGEKGGRSTEKYRQYLKSIAKVYTGSGRKKNVAEAAAVVVSNPENKVSPDLVEFQEFYDDQEYSVILNEFENNRVDLLYEVLDLADPSGVRLRNPKYVVGGEYSGYVEGPKPDEEFVQDDLIDPFNHKSPKRGEYPSNVSILSDNDIFTSDIDAEIVKPIKFNWAKKLKDTSQFKKNASWSEVQWGEDSWSGDVDSGVEFTGVDWDAADWNKFPYTDFGVVGSDEVTFSDSFAQTVHDRIVEDVVSTDPSIVRPNISFPIDEEIQSNEDQFLEIKQSTTVNPEPTFTLEREDFADWNEDNWSEVEWGQNRGIESYIDETQIGDSLEISIVTFRGVSEDVSSNDTTSVNTSQFMWTNEDWDTLDWSQ